MRDTAQEPERIVISEARAGLIGALMVALGPFSMALYTPAMPRIVESFASTDAAVKSTLAMYFAGFAFAQLFCGALSDAIGRRPISIAFLSIYLVASLAGVFAPSIEWLIAARFMQGVGAAAGIVISRAIVRDLFAEESGARIMNLIGIILAVAPALAPTLGGLVLHFAEWHGVFWLMILYGTAVLAVSWALLPETVAFDLGRLKPLAVARSYGQLLASPVFVSAALVLAGSVGALYAQATILPFLLMDRVGLSPAEFGFSMLLQSGSYLVGSIAARPLMARHGAARLVPYGLGLIGIGAVLLAAGLRLLAPSLAIVMGPVALYAFGIAWVVPAMTTNALRPFPRIAGAASAMMGFLQMGLGLTGGALSAVIGDAVLSMASIIPAFGLLSIVSYLVWQRAAGISIPAS